jgi:hypothetical protein
MMEKLQRLAEAGITILPATEITSHYVFARDSYVALVERNGEEFGGIGSAGMLTGSGMAVLVQRGGHDYFVSRQYEQEATPEQVSELRRFAADLAGALQ